MNSAQISALIKRLEAASYAYHNGKPLLMSDAEYDAAIDQLREASPAHPFLSAVGAPVAAGDEVALPVPLPSLNKTKDQEALTKWLTRYPATAYHISAKLDGCSALWLPAAGKLYTRGDGMRGRDISAFVPHFQGLKPAAATAAAPIITAVRGELIMRTDSTQIPEGKLARNIVAGALNRKASDIDTTLFNEIRFIAYELISPATKSPEEAYRLLRTAGYETARATTIDTAKMTAVHLSAVFSNAEEKSPYQMDGIVIAPNTARPDGYSPEVRKGVAVNPADRVAWKTRLTTNTAITTVRAVEWNVSHGGMLIPRVLFDPVVLAGATISAATGLHGRWIYENAVGPDAQIEVRRAGDVIPQIIAVHIAAPAGPAMPTTGFAWDGPVESAVHIKPVGDAVAAEADCVKITHALGELGAENVGSGVVAKLYAAGFTSVGAIYAASQADFAAHVEGCKGKMAERIWVGLRNKQSSWTELNFLIASCAMPRGVGHSKLQPLLVLNPTPATWSAAAFKASRPSGLSDKTIDAIVAAVPAYLTWRAANIPASVTPVPITAAAAPVSVPDGPVMNVVLTGFRNNELESALQTAGHTLADTVTKKTTHVVHPDGPRPTSSKIIKAQEMSIPILTLSEMWALLKK
jgi:NAD-dependent DNA ligase